nr:hypothetical protein [Nitratireductor alexandrii]
MERNAPLGNVDVSGIKRSREQIDDPLEMHLAIAAARERWLVLKETLDLGKALQPA